MHRLLPTDTWFYVGMFNCDKCHHDWARCFRTNRLAAFGPTICRDCLDKLNKSNGTISIKPA